MSTPRPYDPAFAVRVVELARGGLLPPEIAVELAASLADFSAWEAAHPAFAVALADAQTAAWAWWNTQARDAISTNKVFRSTLWAKVMAQNFGRSANLPSKRTDKAAARPVVLARVNIPDNGRKRRNRPNAAGS